MINFFLFFFIFASTYILGGRKMGIPYGIAATSNPLIIIILSLCLDLLQIPIFYFIYSQEKIRLSKNIHVHAKKEKKDIKDSKAWKWARRLGASGVFLLSTMPSFGGGIWSSVLLAFTLKLNKKVSYFLILSGSLLGISVLAFFSSAVIELLKIFWH
ncbi:MAG: small multi-drug export protein [archaeon]